jgi:hypothetical protein
MGKPYDEKVPILPSTTRRGTTLKTSVTLDSPSVMSKLLTPPHAHATTSTEFENATDSFDDACTMIDESGSLVMRVNSTNVLDEGLRIGEIGRRMNSKINSVKQGGYKSKRECRTWLAFNLSHNVPSWPLYIDGQVSRIGWDPTQITISIYDMNSYFD